MDNTGSIPGLGGAPVYRGKQAVHQTAMTLIRGKSQLGITEGFLVEATPSRNE